MVAFAFVRAMVVTAMLMVMSRAWPPSEPSTHKQWATEKIQYPKSNINELSPAVAELKSLIESNTRINMLFTQMFEEFPFTTDRLGQSEIRNYRQLLEALNRVITKGPEWSSKAQSLGLTAAPIVTFMDYPMSTPAGYTAFLDPEVNQIMQNILNEWGKFLSSPESAEVLNDSDQGWFGTDGLQNLLKTANDPYNTSYEFDDFYECPDPNTKHYGFRSWDAFFTRRFKPEVRPLASPDDNNVIVSACEAQPYKLSTNVRLHDKFWIKSQPYSVSDMLAHDELANNFAEGTVYQAYLSALSYHRWHAPVSGKVVKSFVQNGSYFSEPLFQNNTFVYNIDPYSITRLNSQGYLASLATRGIIFIEADNPTIGLMAFIAVGNYEVSTIEINVREGQHVKKGQEMGMFHFGGSSFVLLFREEVELEGFPLVENNMHNVPVRSKLAVVKP